jgi:mRNA interferase MazF
MVKTAYIPEQGDIVWVDFNPTRGHEQKGKRPAFVVSRRAYNEKSGLALLCPITSQEKGYPFEVRINNDKITGVVLSDQLRSVDWKERMVAFIAKSKTATVSDVLAKILTLVQ